MPSRLEDPRRRVDAQDASRTAASLASLWFEAVGYFARQEALMELHAYPGRSAHRAAHHLFLRDLKDLVRELREGGLTEEVSRWARQRVPDSFALHVETHDRPLLQFIIVKGIVARFATEARGKKQGAKRGAMPLDSPTHG
jgi:hemerythrin